MLSARTTRSLAILLVLAAVVCGTAGTAKAADRDFSMIVDHIKRQYHTKPKSSFAMKLAGMVVKMGHPAGIKSMRLAVFEDLTAHADASTLGAGGSGLDAALREGLGPDWHAVVRAYSRKDGDESHVYTRQAGEDFEILVVSIDGSDGTVLKARVSPEALSKFIGDHSDRTHPEHADE